MKKYYLILFLFIALFTSGCGNKNKTNLQAPQVENNQQEQNENPDANCFTICHQKIQDACLEEIIEFGPEELAASGSLMDPASCEITCAANFDDPTLDCFTKITKCDQVGSGDPWCREDEIPDSEIYDIEEPEILNNNCNNPCQKYAVCAGMADDATKADEVSAYNSCMETCSTWSENTISCINNKQINTVSDCANLSLCALQEYQDMMR